MSCKRRRTASRASSAGHETGTNASVPSSPAPSSPAPSSPAASLAAPSKQDKKSKFEKRFNVANKSDQDVLGVFIDVMLHTCTDSVTKKNKWRHGDLRCTGIITHLWSFAMTQMEFPMSFTVNGLSIRIFSLMFCANGIVGIHLWLWREPGMMIARAILSAMSAIATSQLHRGLVQS